MSVSFFFEKPPILFLIQSLNRKFSCVSFAEKPFFSPILLYFLGMSGAKKKLSHSSNVYLFIRRIFFWSFVGYKQASLLYTKSLSANVYYSLSILSIKTVFIKIRQPVYALKEKNSIHNQIFMIGKNLFIILIL